MQASLLAPTLYFLRISENLLSHNILNVFKSVSLRVFLNHFQATLHEDLKSLSVLIRT